MLAYVGAIPEARPLTWAGPTLQVYIVLLRSLGALRFLREDMWENRGLSNDRGLMPPSL